MIKESTQKTITINEKEFEETLILVTLVTSLLHMLSIFLIFILSLVLPSFFNIFTCIFTFLITTNLLLFFYWIKLKRKRNKRSKKIKQIDLPEEAVKGLISSLEDVKEGKYETVKNYKEEEKDITVKTKMKGGLKNE